MCIYDPIWFEHERQDSDRLPNPDNWLQTWTYLKEHAQRLSLHRLGEVERALGLDLDLDVWFTQFSKGATPRSRRRLISRRPSKWSEILRACSRMTCRRVSASSRRRSCLTCSNSSSDDSCTALPAESREDLPYRLREGLPRSLTGGGKPVPAEGAGFRCFPANMCTPPPLMFPAAFPATDGSCGHIWCWSDALFVTSFLPRPPSPSHL